MKESRKIDERVQSRIVARFSQASIARHLGPTFPAEAPQQLCLDEARLTVGPAVEDPTGASGVEHGSGWDHERFSDLITGRHLTG